MLKKSGKAEKPPVTTNKIFWLAFAAAYGATLLSCCKYLQPDGKKWPVALFAAVNILFAAGWLYFKIIYKPQRLQANRNDERVLGGWLLFGLTAFILLRSIKPDTALNIILLLFVALMTAVLSTAVVVLLKTKILMTHIEISTPKINCDRIRIAHFTDIHAGLWAGADMLRALVETVNAAKPDIIVCTGDLKDEKLGEECSAELSRLANLKASHGKFVILGNYDYTNTDFSSAFADACGFTMLNGTAQEAAGIIIAGCGDRDQCIKQQWGLTKSEQLILNYEFVQKHTFLLVLRHRPLIEDGQRTHFDLQLSGAKHGISLLTLALRKLGLSIGRGKCKNCGQGGLLYQTAGAGYIGAPARIFCMPEVVLIDLVKNSGSTEED